MNEFKVGDRVVAKVGRNEINVEILAVEEKSYLVRNNAGKEFHAVRLTALPDVILCIPPVLLCLDSTKRPVPQGKKNIVPPLTASAVSRCVSRRKAKNILNFPARGSVDSTAKCGISGGVPQTLPGGHGVPKPVGEMR